jgi:hypothetical protein
MFYVKLFSPNETRREKERQMSYSPDAVINHVICNQERIHETAKIKSITFPLPWMQFVPPFF